MADQQDELKSQRQAFDFLRELFRQDNALHEGGPGAAGGLVGKVDFDLLVQTVRTIRPADYSDSERRTTEASAVSRNRRVSNCRHVAEVPSSRQPETPPDFRIQTFDLQTVLIFESSPLTNETVLRNTLDAFFYRDTITKKLLAIGVTKSKSQINHARTNPIRPF